MKKLNAQNMTWIDTSELAAKDATIERLTKERDALLEYAEAVEYDHTEVDGHTWDSLRRAALALCEGGE